MSFRAEVKTFAKTRLNEQYGTTLGGILLANAPIILLAIIQTIASIFLSYMLQLQFFYSPFIAPGFAVMFSALLSLLPLCMLFLLPFSCVGCSFLSLTVARRQQASCIQPYTIGIKNYLRKLGGMLWMLLFIVLWSMLFIVPGIIKAYSYRFTPYILADCPNVKATEALKLSMRITDGMKKEIFFFDLSFLGWALLTALTFGILGIYTIPYFKIAEATLFESMKNNALSSGRIVEADLNASTANYTPFAMS